MTGPGETPRGLPEQAGTALGVVVVAIVYAGILWMMARAAGLA